MNIAEKDLNQVKLVFGGLDNAGKTSFIIALRQKYNFYESIERLKPTIEIDYSSFIFLNRFNINIWDMGGQAKYRAMYQENPIYFEGTDFLYYIIDIQDKERFDESLKYLKTLIEILKVNEYTNEIIVCFHKFDPRYEGNLLFTKTRENLEQRILTENPNHQFSFFDTSYYNIASLTYALTYSLNKLVDLDLVYNKLANFSVNHDFTYAGIYDDTGMIIADYMTDVMDKREYEENVKIKIKHDIVLIKKFKEESSDFKENLSRLENHVEYTKKLKTSTKRGNINFYLSIMTPSLEPKEISSEIEDIETVLEKSLQ